VKAKRQPEQRASCACCESPRSTAKTTGTPDGSKEQSAVADLSGVKGNLHDSKRQQARFYRAWRTQL
jgi:hypothetical protein